MKLGRTSRRRVQVLGVGTAPVALILLVRAMAPTAPSAAPAAQPAPAPAPGVLPAEGSVPLTPAQQRAAAWAARPLERPLASPMDHPPGEAAPTPTFIPTPVAAAVPTEAAPPPTLTAVVGRDENARALIDGRVMKLGDMAPGGWTVEAIDARRQRVTLRNSDGRVVEASITPRG